MFKCSIVKPLTMPQELTPASQPENDVPAEADQSEDEEDLIDWITLSKGLKDYEPDNTLIQSNQLQYSLNVMYDIISQPLTLMTKSAIKLRYDEKLHKGVIDKPKGSFMNTVGLANSKNELMLSHIETIYLVSRGTVQPVEVFPVHSDDDSSGEKEEREMSLDILNLYTQFESEEEMEKYWIYAYLKRLGFVVTEYFDQNETSVNHNNKKKLLEQTDTKTVSKLSKFTSQTTSLALSHFNKLLLSISSIFQHKFQPLTTYDLIFQTIKLQITKISKFSTLSSRQFFDLNVWKPSTKYNKTSPPYADHKIKIMNFEDTLKINDIYVNNDNGQVDNKYIMAVIQHGITNYVELKQVDLSKGPYVRY
ncbi:hypothetical protein WICPIJ_007595 [Wickerhamomyces pijperi]|uniref:tRNA-splicing endonuclease subunit Sen54 N-terminal domain-containing protein n=1 Tax=Wickerhamomyces pijperi TaxID=599730 RepID=A0A9P8TJ34_WICPI|nr:hypothetical protein WICPIJ_007595 [Wickerhamomyces pijperi]